MVYFFPDKFLKHSFSVISDVNKRTSSVEHFFSFPTKIMKYDLQRFIFVEIGQGFLQLACYTNTW